MMCNHGRACLIKDTVSDDLNTYAALGFPQRWCDQRCCDMCAYSLFVHVWKCASLHLRGLGTDRMS